MKRQVYALFAIASVLMPMSALAGSCPDNYSPYGDVPCGETRKQSYQITTRCDYEYAIKNGLMARPSKVKDHREALALAQAALRNNDQHEASKRVFQALVIYAERTSDHSSGWVTESFARTLGLESLWELESFDQLYPMCRC